jgi:hypothetical protein
MAVKYDIIHSIRVSRLMAAAIAEAAKASDLRESDYIRRALAAVLAVEGYFGPTPPADSEAA